MREMSESVEVWLRRELEIERDMRRRAQARTMEAAVDLQRLRAENEYIKAALADLAKAFRNPGDGGEFEHGEVPALDYARAVLQCFDEAEKGRR